MSDKLALERRYGATNYDPLPIVLARGEGVWLYDDEGRRYLDMLSAYSAVSFGYGHPKLVKVLAEQAQRLAITSRAFHSERLGPFLARLCDQRVDDVRIGMPEAHRGVRAHEVEVAAAVDVGDPGALAVRQHDRQRIVVARAERPLAGDERRGRGLGRRGRFAVGGHVDELSLHGPVYAGRVPP